MRLNVRGNFAGKVKRSILAEFCDLFFIASFQPEGVEAQNGLLSESHSIVPHHLQCPANHNFFPPRE
jgi:hypothetical protein